MEEVTSNLTIAVTMVYLFCLEVVYLDQILNKVSDRTKRSAIVLRDGVEEGRKKYRLFNPLTTDAYFRLMVSKKTLN